MNANFAVTTSFTRLEEGGYVDSPEDSGNWTSGRRGVGTLIGSNMGVGAPALVEWLGASNATAHAMRYLSVETYDAIATRRYWPVMGCDQLPAGPDLSVYDFGWNAGQATSVLLLQRIVGVTLNGVPDAPTIDYAVDPSGLSILSHMSKASVIVMQQKLRVIPDGDVGLITTRALLENPALRIMGLLLALRDLQVEHYRVLPNWPTYGAGWLARTQRRLAAAVLLAYPAGTPSVV